MADHYFIFNGIDTRDYGFLVTGDTPYAVNAYAYDAQSVDGRDGDIIYSHSRHANVDVTYSLAVKGNGAYGFRSKFEAFRRLISAAEGYCTLTDSYNPGYTRYGYLKATVYPTQAGVDWSSGKVTVTFSCKPQMFMSDGMEYIKYPVMLTGGCSETGIIETSGVLAHKRVGPFEFGDNDACKFRLVNGSDSLTVTVSQVEASGGTWTEYSATDITLDTSGEWVSVSKANLYFWFEFKFDDVTTDFPYIEMCIGDDGKTFRYNRYGIVLINDTGFTAKPQFDLIPTEQSTDFIYLQFYNFDNLCEMNRIWISAHADAGGYNLLFDSEKQTVINENGASMSKYVTMTEDEGKTIFTQSYPVIPPGVNVVSCSQSTAGSVMPRYYLQIKTNIWTV